MLGLTTQKTLDAVTADRDSALAELRQERDRADLAPTLHDIIDYVKRMAAK